MTNKTNPANEKEEFDLPPNYRPMTGGQLRLAVPEKPGFHRHWFRGTPARIAQARQAGYEFVNPEDVDVVNFDLAGSGLESGNTDLGDSRVSVISGDDIGMNGQPGRLYLMECPQKYFDHAQNLLMQQVDMTADALRGGMVGSGQAGEQRGDTSKRYIKEGQNQSLFIRKQP